MKKVKWGVIGTAYICRRNTLPGMLKADNCELYAIAGRSMEKAEQFRTDYGFAVAYGSYDALLDDPAVEAVYVALPNTMHYEWTIKALKKHKHVLCEKPLAPTAAEAEEMFRTARENGVYLMEAFAYLHSPYIEAVRQELVNGAIGEVQYMETNFLTSSYDLTNIRMRRETMGGGMYDLGVYCTSLIQRLLGKTPVTLSAAACFSEENVDRLASVVMQYDDGSRASLTCGITLAKNQHRHVNRFAIYGSCGEIHSENFGFNAEGDLTYSVWLSDGTRVLKTVKTPDNYCLEAEQLGRCILDGATPAVSETFSVENASVVDRIMKAIGY